MQQQNPHRHRNQPQRPNIRQALAGLAREPQGESSGRFLIEVAVSFIEDPNAEAAQADQLTKVYDLCITITHCTCNSLSITAHTLYLQCSL